MRAIFIRLGMVVVLMVFAVNARGQGAMGSPAGLNAMFMKIFEDVEGFSAKADVQVLGGDGKERVTMPMQFTALGEMIRLDINMEELKSKELPASAMASLKTIGMHKVVSVMRPDKKATYVIYPEAQSFVAMPMNETETGKAVEELKVTRTPMGKDQVDGKTYNKAKVVVGDATSPRFQATTWMDPNLKNFPVQIRTADKENAMVMKFREIKLAKPASSQFEVPAGFTEYKTPQAMMMGLASKMMKDAQGTETEKK